MKVITRVFLVVVVVVVIALIYFLISVDKPVPDPTPSLWSPLPEGGSCDIEEEKIVEPEIEFFVDDLYVKVLDNSCSRVVAGKSVPQNLQNEMYETCISFCEKAYFDRFTGEKYCNTQKELVCKCYTKPELLAPVNPEPAFFESAKDETLSVPDEELVERVYSWSVDNYEWTAKVRFSPKRYDFYSDRSRERDYDFFVTDPYDDEFIESIVDSLRDSGRDHSSDELAEIVVSFVQSLRYTSDEVTTGYDEYPRFPYETLYDNGGDCEDTSILAASLLRELDFGVVLLELPNHMAVGVACNGFTGGYITYNEVNYCYLETTGKGYEFGEVPDEYANTKVTIVPIVEKPYITLNFEASSTSSGIGYTYVDVNVTALNLGSIEAENVVIVVGVDKNEDYYWGNSESSDPFNIEPENGVTYSVTGLKVPNGERFRVSVYAKGDNFFSQTKTSNWVN